MAQASPHSSKRIKLEANTTPKLDANEEIEEGGKSCSICLQEISDQTILPICSHEFCFECLLIWTKQSRRCPLCSRGIGEYLIHNVRSKHDFSKHYLTPLRTSPVPQNPLISVADLFHRRVSGRRRPTARERERERRQREELDEVDRLQRSIGKRRWVYRHGLYAKHVASNAFTRYKPYPSPAQFSVSPDLISRTTSFVRRELQVWPNLDVEFLTTFTTSIMKSIDIRSESAVKLLAEFLDMDSPYVEGGRHVNAEHYAHEIYSFVRSPYRDIFIYDDVVQYDIPPHIPSPPRFYPRRRWRRNSPSPSRSRTGTPSESHSRSASRSIPSRSPSLHNFTPDLSLCPQSPPHHVNGHGCTESTRPPLPARETGSDMYQTTAQLRRDRGQRNQGEAEEEMEHPRDLREQPENQKPHGGHSEHPLFRPHNMVVDSKGKRVADAQDETKKNDFDNVVERKPSKPDINVKHKHHSETLPSSSTQPKVVKLKPPRNRSLRECVEAHIGSGKRKAPERSGDRKDTILHSKKGYLDADNPAALPSGSFNSIPFLINQVRTAGSDNVASTSSCRSAENGKPGANPVIGDGKASEISHASPNPLWREPRIVSPRDTDTAMLAIETSSQDQDPFPSLNGVISMDIEYVGKGRPIRAISINNAADHDIHLRSRLLSRLEEEKNCAYAKMSADSTCSFAPRQLVESAVTSHKTDSLAVEDSLRKRARLRMKLAAEKRTLNLDDTVRN